MRGIRRQLPTREEFLEFWRVASRTRFRDLAAVAAYLAGVLSYVGLLRHFDREHEFALWGLLGGVLLTLAVPPLYVFYYWRRFDRYLRCPHCRVWVGRDVSGAWQGPTPMWRVIAESGRCVKCGAAVCRASAAAE